MSIEPNFIWHEGADPLSLAEHLAAEVAIQINACIAERGIAIVALSGGSTPKPFFSELAQHDIDWSKVLITLVDERWVDESNELSNAAFMKTHLLNQISETKPTFLPLYQSADSVEASLSNVLASYCEVTNSSTDKPAPFDVVILGMGGDGHTASFFPDAENIDSLTDQNSKEYLLSCESPTTQVPRITWSVPMLLSASFLGLHFTGQQKASVFQQACSGYELSELPIRSAIFQTTTPLNVYYAD